MKEFLRVPLGLYAALFICLALLTVVWNKTELENYRLIINYLGALFFWSTILGVFLIRMESFEKYKNILNAVWNIQAACAFIYVTYLAVAYSLASLKTPEVLMEWARENNGVFIFLIVLLNTVVIMRAGFSLAELFKVSILINKKRRAVTR